MSREDQKGLCSQGSKKAALSDITVVEARRYKKNIYLYTASDKGCIAIAKLYIAKNYFPLHSYKHKVYVLYSGSVRAANMPKLYFSDGIH